jgi:hypothetical protein
MNNYISLRERWEAHAEAWGMRDLGYNDLVLTMGVEIIEQETFGEFEGDIVYHVKRGDEHGILIVGFGSCSGCDALQGTLCYSDEWTDDIERNVTALRDQLQASIIWPTEGKTLTEMIEERISGSGWWENTEVETYARMIAKSADARQ